ncbi:hypothetical protein [Arthrobacter nitrophenolicus]|uniref:hypothetical protein n=1 Tax=Arthrobacter nitrophenolicus TaxID=683150 RepID=UPI001404EA59|nr:hypothetical protein [Arthrobacter nitrophenolicus]
MQWDESESLLLLAIGMLKGVDGVLVRQVSDVQSNVIIMVGPQAVQPGDGMDLMTAVARFGDDEQQHRAQQLIAAGKISGS